MKTIDVIGAGLAGCEAAWQAARLGVPVRLHEMKPHKRTPAHRYDGFAVLVCSNSLRVRRMRSARSLMLRLTFTEPSSRRKRRISPEIFGTA